MSATKFAKLIRGLEKLASECEESATVLEKTASTNGSGSYDEFLDSALKTVGYHLDVEVD